MNRFFLFMSTFIVAVLFAGSGYADTKYTVRKGDNPSTIAKKFGVAPEELIRVNAIDPERLSPGTRITIPPRTKKKHRTTLARETVKKKEAAPLPRADAAPHQNNAQFHIVRKGDTLASLSRRYSVSQQDLIDINSLPSTKLKIGQRIELSRPEASDYVIRKGDTIWSIARRFDLDPNELIEINGLESASVKPNQKIILKRPPDVTDVRHFEAILSTAPEETMAMPVSVDPETGESAVQRLRERLVLFAHKMIDIPYRFGGNSLLGIDCSAYVKKVYGMIGIDLPRSAREQFQEGIPVDEENLSIGDLVFFSTYASYPSHVGIYLGNNLFIHASSKKKRVTIDSLDTPFYIKRFIGAKRLLDMSAADGYGNRDG